MKNIIFKFIERQKHSQNSNAIDQDERQQSTNLSDILTKIIFEKTEENIDISTLIHDKVLGRKTKPFYTKALKEMEAKHLGNLKHQE